MWLMLLLILHPDLQTALLWAVGGEQKDWEIERVTSMAWGLARDFWFAFLTKDEEPCLHQAAPPSWGQNKLYLSSQATASHSSKTAQAPALPRRGKHITLLLWCINFLIRKYLTGVSRGCPGKSSQRVPVRDSPHCFPLVREAPSLFPLLRGKDCTDWHLWREPRSFSSLSPAESSWLKGHVFGGSRRNWDQKDFSAQSQFYSRIHVLIF